MFDEYVVNRVFILASVYLFIHGPLQRFAHLVIQLSDSSSPSILTVISEYDANEVFPGQYLKVVQRFLDKLLVSVVLFLGLGTGFPEETAQTVDYDHFQVECQLLLLQLRDDLGQKQHQTIQVMDLNHFQSSHQLFSFLLLLLFVRIRHEILYGVKTDR